MKLYLVRHGQAEDLGQRPLSQRGEKEVQVIADFLKSTKSSIKSIWHSDKLRSQQTANIIQKNVCPNAKIILQKGLNPNDEPNNLIPHLEILRENTLIVSHLPFLPNLCGALLANNTNLQLLQFKTASIACLDNQSGIWEISWFINPDII